MSSNLLQNADLQAIWRVVTRAGRSGSAEVQNGLCILQTGTVWSRVIGTWEVDERGVSTVRKADLEIPRFINLSFNVVLLSMRWSTLLIVYPHLAFPMEPCYPFQRVIDIPYVNLLAIVRSALLTVLFEYWHLHIDIPNSNLYTIVQSMSLTGFVYFSIDIVRNGVLHENNDPSGLILTVFKTKSSSACPFTAPFQPKQQTTFAGFRKKTANSSLHLPTPKSVWKHNLSETSGHSQYICVARNALPGGIELTL